LDLLLSLYLWCWPRTPGKKLCCKASRHL